MLVKELVSLNAPSGFEDEVRDFIKSNVTADEIHIDSIGNLICRKKGNGKKVMVCAHMDEVGFLSANIEEDGIINLLPVGGHYPLKINGCPLRLKNKEGKIFKGKFVTNETGDVYKLDLGFSSKESIKLTNKI